MARYIDADTLEEKLKLYIKSWSGDSNSNAERMVKAYECALYWVSVTPSADVVPKSEVARFAEEIKLEFYREFDEIIPSIMADKIDELKKKYTEGE